MANKKARGKRAKTRHYIRGKKRLTGITRQFEDIPVGRNVQIKIDGSTHSGMPFRRFHGRAGQIIGKRGTCYLVSIHDQNLEKTVLAHPNHLQVML